MECCLYQRKSKMYYSFQLIPGNTNTYTPRKTVLEAPFVASKVRFFPYASHPRTACMRVELYGCRWKRRYNKINIFNSSRCPGTMRSEMLWRLFIINSIVSAIAIENRLRRYIYAYWFSTEAIITYSAPRGGDMQAMTGGARFEDLSFDGVSRAGRLFDGLGQLTDSYVGPNDFELPDPLDTRGKFKK